MLLLFSRLRRRRRRFRFSFLCFGVGLLSAPFSFPRDHHQIRGGRRRGRRGRRVSRSSTTAPPFGRASRSRRVRLQLSSRVWSSFDSEAYHHSVVLLSLLFSLSLSSNARSRFQFESPIETSSSDARGRKERERAREREREREKRGEAKERKCLSRSSLSQSNERECFVSSRYVVVVCALLYVSCQRFFTLFEKWSSFITTERRKHARKEVSSVCSYTCVALVASPFTNRTTANAEEEEEEEEEEEDPFFVRDFVLLSLSTQDRKT